MDYDEFRLLMRSLHRRNPALACEEYERRYGDVRPAVRVADKDELQTVIRHMPMLLDWDTLGGGWIVYPAKREG